MILSGQVKYIDKKFNWLSYLHRAEDISINEKNNIILIHFAIHPKPWSVAWKLSPNCNKFTANIYKNYEDLSPFANTPLVYPTYYKEMKRYAKYLRWHKNYLKSLKWYLKYSISKIIYMMNCQGK